MSKRHAAGLCYFCDEKYPPGHFLKHKKTQLSVMEVEDEDELTLEEQEMIEDQEGGEIAQISVNAVTGVLGYRTMRVKALAGNRTIFVFIDSGSTHNFIDPKVAENLGCELLPASTARVAVADGRKLGVSGKINNLQWNFQPNSFTADFNYGYFVGRM